MLSKNFVKVTSSLLAALSLVACAGPVTAYASPSPEKRAAVPLKQDWDTAAIKHIRLALSRRRRQTEVKQNAQAIRKQVWKKFIDHLLKREGYRNVVYRDSLGKPTVGIGHLVRAEDNLKVGDRISDQRVREFLEQDASYALDAAIKQAAELDIDGGDFIIALGSVNFQLGTGWRNKFPQTWQHLKDGNYAQAIRNIQNSQWAKQTPVRTHDFIKAIRKVMEQEKEFNAVSLNPAFKYQSSGMPLVAYQYG